MVAIHRLAILGFLSSSFAIQLPPLDALLDSVVDSVSSGFEQDDSAKVIETFPSPDERPVPGNAPIINCDSTTPQILDLQKVVIDPSPPVKGQNLTFLATGLLSEDIEEGAYVDIDVRYGFIRLIHQTFDICEEVEKVDLKCPIEKGELVISRSVEIPAEVPPGKYVVNARAYTKDDEYITCLTATVEFPASSKKSL